MGEEKGLINKIGWAYKVRDTWPSDIQLIASCQKLESQGFGMLADKENPVRIDGSDSVVCPDGTVLTPKQINFYWNQKDRKYNPKDPENFKMHRAYMYYLGFKS